MLTVENFILCMIHAFDTAAAVLKWFPFTQPPRVSLASAAAGVTSSLLYVTRFKVEVCIRQVCIRQVCVPDKCV